MSSTKNSKKKNQAEKIRRKKEDQAKKKRRGIAMNLGKTALIIIALITLSLTFTYCEKLEIEPGSCDFTIKPEIYVGMEINVFVETEREMNNVKVTAKCSKKPCGAEIKGVYEITNKVYPHNGDRKYFMTQFRNHHYYLRNAGDKILVEVTCVDGFGQVKGFSNEYSYQQLMSSDKDFYHINMYITY